MNIIIILLALANLLMAVESIFLVIPEDVPTGLVGIYGFAPRLLKGTDSRLGFGFRLGNHADFQIVYEFGPQQNTRLLRTRASSPQKIQTVRSVRRRPFIQFLLKTGFLSISTPEYYDDEEVFDGPR